MSFPLISENKANRLVKNDDLPKNIKIIIVTYNSDDCIANCLRSLEKASEKFKLHITIVDNVSTDNTLSIVKGFGSDIHLIRNTRNLGYGGGNNIAIKAMLSELRLYTAVLILNPDVILTPCSVDELISVLYRFPEVGGVSPNVIDGAELNGMHRLKTLFGLPMRQEIMANENAIEVDRLYGCCMLVKPVFFEKVGLFDEAYFLYWEELDLCVRAGKVGFKLLICNNVTILHRLNKSERVHRIYYMWRNQIYFALKNFGGIKRVVFLSRRFFSNLKELLSFLRSKRFDLILAGLTGFLAGIMGEKGRSSNRYSATSIKTRETNVEQI